jgi:hypothetical protein
MLEPYVIHSPDLLIAAGEAAHINATTAED